MSAAPRLFFLLGDPIGHSLSPVLFAAAFSDAGIDARYSALRVSPSELAGRFSRLREAGVEGFNLTLPHKRAIMPLLDRLDPAAALVGAVNTVAVREGCATGYNTDVAGFLLGLAAAGAGSPAGREVLVLGAGGAARGVLAGLAREGASRVTVANRSLERAGELAGWGRETFPGMDVSPASLVAGELPAGCGGVSLCVQATSLGLRPRDPLPLDPALLPPGCFLYDLVYAPGGTPLVRRALAGGRPAADGREMLLRQAGEGFTIWFGSPAPLAAMRRALEDGLAGAAGAPSP